MAIKDFYRGNTIKYNLTFTQASDNTPIDITGWLIFLTFKSAAEDPDSDAIIQKVYTMPVSTDSTNGIANITLSTDETNKFPESGTYFYGFKRVIPGSPPDVYTLETGKVKVSLPAANLNEEYVHIPDVFDVASAQAQTDITNAGLVVGTITNVTSTVTVGNVVSTDPIIDEYVVLGSTVNLNVSA